MRASAGVLSRLRAVFWRYLDSVRNRVFAFPQVAASHLDSVRRFGYARSRDTAKTTHAVEMWAPGRALYRLRASFRVLRASETTHGIEMQLLTGFAVAIPCIICSKQRMASESICARTMRMQPEQETRPYAALTHEHIKQQPRHAHSRQPLGRRSSRGTRILGNPSHKRFPTPN